MVKRGRPKCNMEEIGQKKSLILVEASKAFAKHGYGHTDVTVVADAIGVCKGTIYYYFKNKEELFLASVDWLMQELLKSLQEVLQTNKDSLSIIEDAIFAYLSFFDAHPEFIELLVQERAIFKNRKIPTYFKYSESNKQWHHLYADLIKEGRLREMPPERILKFIGKLLYGVVLTSYFSGESKLMKNHAKYITDIYFNGILSDAETSARKIRKVKK